MTTIGTQMAHRAQLMLIFIPGWENMAEQNSESESLSVIVAQSPSHVNTHIPRGTGRGGGVAAIFDSGLLINPKPKLNYKSFESLVLSLSHPTWKTLQPILLIIVYRAPGPYSEFLSEFSEFLSSSPQNR